MHEDMGELVRTGERLGIVNIVSGELLDFQDILGLVTVVPCRVQDQCSLCPDLQCVLET